MTRLGEPATALQRGAVMGEFRRLGLDTPRHHSLRHAIGAGLLGLPGLGDWRELTKGQAGALLRSLQDHASADEVITAAGLRTPQRASGTRGRTRLLARLLAACIAAEMAARTRQEETRDAIPANAMEGDPARHPL